MLPSQAPPWFYQAPFGLVVVVAVVVGLACHDKRLPMACAPAGVTAVAASAS
jgi:hypothetical protein